MKLIVCAVFDKMTGAFMQPFFTRTNYEAVRNFKDAVTDGSTVFNKHPEDYCLFKLAEFDDNTGTLVSLDVTEKLIDGLSCVAT